MVFLCQSALAISTICHCMIKKKEFIQKYYPVLFVLMRMLFCCSECTSSLERHELQVRRRRDLVREDSVLGD